MALKYAVFIIAGSDTQIRVNPALVRDFHSKDGQNTIIRFAGDHQATVKGTPDFVDQELSKIP